jgi:D-alanyl-D-alanine carboxypeptidase
MRFITILTMASFLTLSAVSHAGQKNADFDTAAKKMLGEHFTKYQVQEYYSGAELSVSMPDQPIHNYYIGNVSHDKNSEKVTATTLFQIGSITKSFTAAMVLQLEKEKFLSLNDSLTTHLPNYTKWSNVTLAQMLNMTSGLPNYSDTPLLNTVEAKNPSAVWSNEELIHFVYPRENLNPPLKAGYFYSNTGYVLTDMLITKLTHHTFKDELIQRTITPAKLTNTFYPLPTVDKVLKPRLAHGYNYNQYDNPALVGADMINNNLSWAAAAGAVISNSEDVIKWVQALFIGNAILDDAQKQKLTSIVSLQSGTLITKTTAEDTHAFGLGVAQIYNKEFPAESMWFYEGQTLGFRAIYIYVPCNKVVISTIFNSATNSENDHAIELVKGIYKLVIKQNPNLRCS